VGSPSVLRSSMHSFGTARDLVEWAPKGGGGCGRKRQDRPRRLLDILISVVDIVAGRAFFRDRCRSMKLDGCR
jgi:hypothetical protein